MTQWRSSQETVVVSGCQRLRGSEPNPAAKSGEAELAELKDASRVLTPFVIRYMDSRPEGSTEQDTSQMWICNRACIARTTIGFLMLPLAGLAHGQSGVDGLPLIAAARTADTTSARALLADGADVNGRYGDGSTALHWAAHRDAADLVAMLLTAGADVNAADDHGVTALSLSCLNGNAAVVEMLLAAGADANAARVNGETP